jgi:hypothetical protein
MACGLMGSIGGDLLFGVVESEPASSPGWARGTDAAILREDNGASARPVPAAARF